MIMNFSKGIVRGLPEAEQEMLLGLVNEYNFHKEKNAKKERYYERK